MGSVHADRQYVAYLDGPLEKAQTLSFDVKTIAGIQAVRIDSLASRVILFVVPRADAISIRLSSCAESAPYALRPTNLTRDFSFDDGAAWIKKDGVTALPMRAAALTTVLLPDFSARLHRHAVEEQGSVRVVVAIGADGVVLDSELVESSGSQDLDSVALGAALRLRFVPARLPAASDAFIPSIDVIEMTFSPGTATATAGRGRA